MYERYHSCGKKNRNSTCKEIYYKLGGRSGLDNKCGTNKRLWKDAKSKYLKHKTYFNQHRKQLLDEKYAIERGTLNILLQLKEILRKRLLKLGFHNIHLG